MQMSAMKACFQIAECSLSYAKVQNNPYYMIGYDEILGIIISVLMPIHGVHVRLTFIH